MCLPDETNALLERRAKRQRKYILSRDPDNRPLYVTVHGASVQVRSKRIEVVDTKGQQLASLRLLDISQVLLFGNVQISAQALGVLFSANIPILWLSPNGWLKGFSQSSPSKYVELRRRQVIMNMQGELAPARMMIAGKIKNQRTLLRRNAREDVEKTIEQMALLAQHAEEATSAKALRGYEGTAARLYFNDFTKMLTGDSLFAMRFEENGRMRRPAPDPVNALLGFTYALLVKDIVATCISVGLDPYLGVFHASKYGRPSMALAIMEEFRSIIADSVVISLINTAQIHQSHFIKKYRATWLTEAGRKKLITAYEKRLETKITHPIFGYKISYRRVLEIQTRIMAAVIIGELETYTPMVTR